MAEDTVREAVRATRRETTHATIGTTVGEPACVPHSTLGPSASASIRPGAVLGTAGGFLTEPHNHRDFNPARAPAHNLLNAPPPPPSLALPASRPRLPAH